MDDKLLKEIKVKMGRRLHTLRRDEDDYQNFWLGVLEALSNVDWSRDPIPFLISRGFGAVRNQKRSQMSAELARYCKNCGVYHGFRTRICPVCKSDMQLIRRHAQFIEHKGDFVFDGVIGAVMFQQFVDSIENEKQKYIARRWLIERADVFYDNHSKQIALELGISAPAVAKHKKAIRKRFLEWYYGSN